MINSLETVKIEIPQPQPQVRQIVLPDPAPMPAMAPESVNMWTLANEQERKERRAFRRMMVLVWLFIVLVSALVVYFSWRIGA